MNAFESIDNLEVEINRSDDPPVQKNSDHSKTPLRGCEGVNIEDLINRKRIRKSHSAYYSPTVFFVQQKDVFFFLRLSIDCRELKRKTHPERHPILRIQRILNDRWGNKWFTVLDQGKAYHQVFGAEMSRPLTPLPRGGCISGTGSHLVYKRPCSLS